MLTSCVETLCRQIVSDKKFQYESIQCSSDEKTRYNTFSALRITRMEKRLHNPDKMSAMLSDRSYGYSPLNMHEHSPCLFRESIHLTLEPS